VGPRAGLDTVEKRNFAPTGTLTWAFESVTDSALPTPELTYSTNKIIGTSKNYKWNRIFSISCSKTEFLRSRAIRVNARGSVGGAESCNPVTASTEPGLWSNVRESRSLIFSYI
jgi:hypothetical protein